MFVCVCACTRGEGSAADSNSVATRPHPGRLQASLLEPIVLDKYLSSGHPPSRPLSQTPEQKLWFKKGSRLPAEGGVSLPLLQVRSLRSGKAPAGPLQLFLPPVPPPSQTTARTQFPHLSAPLSDPAPTLGWN